MLGISRLLGCPRRAGQPTRKHARNIPAAGRRAERRSRSAPGLDLPDGAAYVVTSLLCRLGLRPPAARADELLGRHAVADHDEWLQVGAHPSVSSNTVHARRLRIEAAHRAFSADCAGAGHRGPQVCSSWESAREGSERGGMIAHGWCPADRPRPPARTRAPRSEDRLPHARASRPGTLRRHPAGHH